MADTINNCIVNLDSMRIDLGRLSRALKFAYTQANEEETDDERMVNKIVVVNTLAGMIIIKACSFKDEIDHQLLKYHANIIDEKMQYAINKLDELFTEKPIKALRNSVLAHNNRVAKENYKLLHYEEIQAMVPYQNEEEYHRLTDCCNQVCNSLMPLYNT